MSTPLSAPRLATASSSLQPSPLEALNSPVYPVSARLIVRDAEAMIRFYRDRLGFEPLGKDGASSWLGAGGFRFLELVERPTARLHSGRESGLFHIAYLLPSRGEIARWFITAHAAGAPFDGASDHDVSEAFYLSDPEGNGIEIYVDRPRERWAREQDGYAMDTRPMALRELVATAGNVQEAPPALPAETRIGHFHLQTGDAAALAAFWQDLLGAAETHRRPGARFLSWGGYHHHLGINNWNSRGAGPRDPQATGLEALTFAVRDPELLEALGKHRPVRQDGSALEVMSPDGIRLRFEPA